MRWDVIVAIVLSVLVSIGFSMGRSITTCSGVDKDVIAKGALCANEDKCQFTALEFSQYQHSLKMCQERKGVQNERIRTGITNLVEGAEGYPATAKDEKCAHGVWGDHDCIGCYDEAISKILDNE